MDEASRPSPRGSWGGARAFTLTPEDLAAAIAENAKNDRASVCRPPSGWANSTIDRGP